MNYNSSRNKTHQFSMKHAPNWYFMTGFSTTTKNWFSSSSNFQPKKKSTRTWEPGLVTSKLHHPGSWRRKIGKASFDSSKEVEAQLVPIIFGDFWRCVFSLRICSEPHVLLSCFFWMLNDVDNFWREDMIILHILPALSLQCLKKNHMDPFYHLFPDTDSDIHIHLGQSESPPKKSKLHRFFPWGAGNLNGFSTLLPGFGLCHSGPPQKKQRKGTLPLQ